jgi:hypothetical protein
VAVDQRRVVGQDDEPAATGRGAEHVEHLGVGEGHLEEAIGAGLAGGLAVVGPEADDDRGDREIVDRAADQRDGVGQRRAGQAAGQDDGAGAMRLEPGGELGDRGHHLEAVAERQQRTGEELDQHRVDGDDDDVHEAPPADSPSRRAMTWSRAWRSWGLVTYSSTPASKPRTRSMRSARLVTITMGTSR